MDLVLDHCSIEPTSDAIPLQVPKYIKAKEKEGLIKVRVVGKGEPAIISINTSHPLFLEFVPYKVKLRATATPAAGAAASTSTAATSSSSSAAAPVVDLPSLPGKAAPAEEAEPSFEVVELVKPPSKLAPVFDGAGEYEPACLVSTSSNLTTCTV